MKYDYSFFVVDFETGGLPAVLKKKATLEVAMTEIAVVVVNSDLNVVEKKSWLVKPNYVPNLIYEQKALDVSGITMELLNKAGIELNVVFNEFCEVIKKHKTGNKKPILTGHNLDAFDLEFMINLFSLFKKDIGDYFHEDTIDTMKWGRLKFIENHSFNLGAVAEKFGLNLVQAHRALPDTEITAKILINLLSSLRSTGEVNKKRYRETFTFDY